MDSKGNQLVKKRLLKFWVVLGLYGLPTGSATGRMYNYTLLVKYTIARRMYVHSPYCTITIEYYDFG